MSSGEGFGAGVWALLGAVALVLSAWSTWRVLIALDRRQRRRRAERARQGEQRAVELLQSAGFRVQARQARIQWACSVNGAPSAFELIADYIVTRQGRTWVAEVKTGAKVPSLRHGPTRRQLLEYQQAFGTQGVVLVDAQNDCLYEVEFAPLGLGSAGSTGDGERHESTSRLLVVGSFGLAVGVAVGWALAHC